MKSHMRHGQRAIRQLVLLCCGLGLFGVSAAFAQWMNGENVIRVCNPAEQGHVFHPGVCSGYIMAAIDLDEDLAARGLIAKPLFCMPEDVPISRVTTVVIDYIKAHPDRKNDSGGILVIDALGDTYPCKH